MIDVLAMSAQSRRRTGCTVPMFDRCISLQNQLEGICVVNSGMEKAIE